MRAKASSTESVVVEWANERSTVEDDKIKQVIQGWNQVATELQQCGNAKEKVFSCLSTFFILRFSRWLSTKSNLWIQEMLLRKPTISSVEKLQQILMHRLYVQSNHIWNSSRLAAPLRDIWLLLRIQSNYLFQLLTLNLTL